MPDQFNPDPLLLPGKSPADPAQAAGFLGNQAAGYLGLPEMVKALRGQQTPEEGQDFFMQQVPNLLGPEAKFGSLAALGLLPRIMRSDLSSDLVHGIQTGASHSFDIVNELNKPVARTWLSQPNPKTLHVEMIRALDPDYPDQMLYGKDVPNMLGLKEMKTLIPQIKQHFPEVEKIEGYRISGARDKARNEAEQAGKKIPSSMAELRIK